MTALTINATSTWGRAAPWIFLGLLVVVLAALSISLTLAFRNRDWCPVALLAAVVVAGLLMVVPAHGSTRPPATSHHSG